MQMLSIIRRIGIGIVGAAAMALTMPVFAQATASASVCASTASVSSGGTKVCAFDSVGVQSTVLSVTTLATPQAISSALSAAISGSIGGGFNRTPLSSARETGAAAAAARQPWNGWFALAQNNVGYTFQPLQSSGNVGLALAGIDYTFGNNVILGLAASWDRTRISTTFNNGNLNGSGYMLAPYIAVPFARSWVFDASAGWGKADLSQVDNSVAGGVTGTTTDKRTFGSLGLSYATNAGKWQFTGKGVYMSAEDRVAQFTLSDRTSIAANTTRISQLRIGAQAAYDAGGLVPFLGLHYIYDVQRPVQAAINGQTPSNDRDAWQVQAGMNFYSRGPVSGSILFSSDTARSQVKNNQLMGNIAIRF